jgi:hypothetical protein
MIICVCNLWPMVMSHSHRLNIYTSIKQCYDSFICNDLIIHFCTHLIMEPTVPGAKGLSHLKLICLLLEAKGPNRPRAKGLNPFIY